MKTRRKISSFQHSHSRQFLFLSFPLRFNVSLHVREPFFRKALLPPVYSLAMVPFPLFESLDHRERTGANRSI